MLFRSGWSSLRRRGRARQPCRMRPGLRLHGPKQSYPRLSYRTNPAPVKGWPARRTKRSGIGCARLYCIALCLSLMAQWKETRTLVSQPCPSPWRSRWGSRRELVFTRVPGKKSGRPHVGRPGLAKSSGEEGKLKPYSDGGFALADGLEVAGACWVGVVPAPVLVIRRISTRRFLARPSAVLFVSTGLSLPRPIR